MARRPPAGCRPRPNRVDHVAGNRVLDSQFQVNAGFERDAGAAVKRPGHAIGVRFDPDDFHAAVRAGLPHRGQGTGAHAASRKPLRLICIAGSVADFHGLQKPAGESGNENCRIRKPER